MTTLRLLIALCCLLPLTLWSEYEEFNLTDGRSLYARIIEADSENVVLERTDGLTFTLAPSVFTEEDQALIREWRIQAYLQEGEMFKAGGKAHAGKLSVQEEDGLILKNWSCWYSLTVENRTDLDLGEIRLEYEFTVRRGMLARPGKDSTPPKPEPYEGRFTIEELKAGESLAFDTRKIQLKSTELEPGWTWPGGGDDPITDEISPLKARLLFRGETVAQFRVKPAYPSEEKSPLAKEKK